MSINIQELVNFRVNGLNELLTDTQKHQLIICKKQLEQLKYEKNTLQTQIDLIVETIPIKTFYTANNQCFQRKLLAVDVDYNLKQKAKIFLHGKSNYKIWFLNKANKLCVIDNNVTVAGNLYLTINFDVKKCKTNVCMSLDRFLYLVEIGEFKITNKKFIKYYLKPYHESKQVAEELKALKIQQSKLEETITSILNSNFYKSIEEIYTRKENTLTQDFKESITGLTRGVEAEKAARKRAKQKKKQAELKALWESVITEEAKAYLLGWICKHIDNIYIKVVKGGVSDRVISASYPDAVYGNKYREKANSSGWDASSGKLRFDTTENAPIHIIKALQTNKHKSRSNDADKVFNNKTINDLDLTLFILSNYNKYGFKSGVKHLNQSIDHKAILEDCFPFGEDFLAGYNQ